MTRSVWKGPFVHPSLLKKIDKLKDTPNKKPIKTWSRNSTIIPDFVGHSFMIHNGKSFISITISLGPATGSAVSSQDSPDTGPNFLHNSAFI